MKFILASASPRRMELLSQIVKDFEIIPAKGEECADGSLPPERVACKLAENKCAEVFEKNSGALVIACDTIVVYNGVILGKPKSADDAAKTLKMLSGKTPGVITGVCVRCGNTKIIEYEKTKVRFNDLSDKFIKDYVAGGSPMDKAGSYGIQDGGVVQSYSGSYTNVVGLPVELVKKIIEEVLLDE
ncbi:MAG: Maf family protein [Clostridia bacterium]|nr:Maf family protein [Clostridia bacterium]